ncbi:MAG: endo-1,3-alpha-glucanase family glycosylhydrolase [Anaerolineae bacterium]
MNLYLSWGSLRVYLHILTFYVLISFVAPAAYCAEPPLVLAIYYAWYDENSWTEDKISDMPATPYASRDREAMLRHIRQAKEAGIDAFLLSWLGPGNPTEENLSTLLSLAEEENFRVGIYFETDSPFFHTQGDIIAALRHALEVHAAHPAFLRYEGRPVIFFWRMGAIPLEQGQTPLEAWADIRSQVDPERDAFWVAEGVDIAYQEIFDGHHLYSIAWSPDVKSTLADWAYKVRNYGRLWVATVMPGYNDLLTGREDAFVREREGGKFYRQCWKAALESGADWVLITSWNEWVEGSQIEPSVSYGDLYLQLTREWAARFKGGGFSLSISPSPVGEEAVALIPTLTPTAVSPELDAGSPALTEAASPTPSPTAVSPELDAGSPAPTEAASPTPSPISISHSLSSIPQSPSSIPHSPVSSRPLWDIAASSAICFGLGIFALAVIFGVSFLWTWKRGRGV